MRRLLLALFPALGVVVLLLAYASQFAAGAPSPPTASAQTGAVVRLLVDETRALKHITVAEDMPLDSLPADPKTRRLVRHVKRVNAWVERHADQFLADAHKAQAAQATPDPATTEALVLEAANMLAAGLQSVASLVPETRRLPSTSTKEPGTPTESDLQKEAAEAKATLYADVLAQLETLVAMQQAIELNIVK